MIRLTIAKNRASALSRRSIVASFATTKDGDNKSKKENFAKKFLEPAARGELQKHQSGIPKLAVRKPKGHSVKDSFPGKESDEILKDALAYSTESSDASAPTDVNKKSSKAAGQRNVRRNEAKAEDYASLFEGPKDYELDPTKFDNNRKWLGSKVASAQSSFRQQRNIKQQRQSDRPNYDMWGDIEFQGDIDDPWETDALYFKYENKHDESKRQAKPIKFPANRTNPPAEWVESYESFAYVTNVPRPVVDNELGSYSNPLHKVKVEEFVADAFSVPLQDVFSANMTSAFVGFKSAKEASDAIQKSEVKRIIVLPHVETSMYSSTGKQTEEEKDFVGTETDKIVKVENIPAGMKTNVIARLLQVVENITENDICMASPTTALIKTSSASDAKKLLSNSKFENAFKNLQRQILRVQPAQRELAHDKFGGPLRKFQMKKMTHKLVVDGDLPSEPFFLSHGHVLHLSNVPIGTSKKQISEYFQQFCVQPRDIEGSIEFVKSIDGHPTGRAYVGFDLETEGAATWDHILSQKQIITFNKAGPATRVQPVKEIALVRGSKLGARSERSQEELIASFNDWKNDVDPKDLETLESFGITMVELEETFRAARKSPTFAVEDQARQGERMREEYAPGEHFKDFVKLYIETLKEVGATRENPGLKFEGLFMPDEELEYSLFDYEEERIRELREKHNN